MNYLKDDVHFEVYVTHDLGEEKIRCYQKNKFKCIRIDLSDPSLLSAQPQKIEDEVLNQYDNKKFIYWNDELEKESELKKTFELDKVILGLLIFLGLGIMSKFFRNKNRRTKLF